MRLLFAAHASVGHTNALVAMARRFQREGDEVCFALPAGRALPLPLPEIMRTAAELPGAIQAKGVPVVRLRPAFTEAVDALLLPISSGYGELRRAIRLFTGSAVRFARDLVELNRTFRADAVVGDFSFPGAWFAAELAGLPYAAVYHSGLPFDLPGAPPFGSGLAADARHDERWQVAEATLQRLRDYVSDRLAQAREQLGLAPLPPAFFVRPHSPDLNLLLTHPSLEPWHADLGPTARWVGPCLEPARDLDESFPWDRLEPGATRVYLSLGTVFNTRPGLFRTLLEGLDVPGVQVIVSAGASADALARDLPHTRALVFRRVPQLALLDHVDVVVTHGGNNTTNEALRAGRPLLVVPVGAEQVANARRVEGLGAGRMLPLQGLCSSQVRTAFEGLRSGPFPTRAREIAQALQGVDGLANAVGEIRSLVTRHQARVAEA